MRGSQGAFLYHKVLSCIQVHVVFIYNPPSYTHTQTLAHKHTHTHTHTHTHAHTCKHTPHTHSYTCKHTHTLTHTRAQINFFQDHTKIIICPLMSAVSYIGEDKTIRTFRFSLIERHGCNKELYSRMRYAKTMTERLISKLDKQSPRVPMEHQPTPVPTPTPLA